MLDKMRANISPSHLVVVWDGGLAAERIAVLPEYKAQRTAIPPDLERQIEDLYRYLHAAGIASYCQDGIEADDWIAAMTGRAAAVGVPVIIASSDKDFMQLVCRGRVGLLNPNDKSERIWTDEDVRAKTGVLPEQIVDWLSLIGDSVDNIPGVEGIGPKTAAALLNQFGSIDCLYKRLEEVKSDRLRNHLRAAAAIVQRNRQLIRLNDNLADLWPVESTLIRSPDLPQLRVLYAEWGFKTLLAQISAPSAQAEFF
jgi:DNA polymerase-1